MITMITKTMNGERELDGEAKLFSGRKIYISGDIDAALADEIGKRILLLNMQSDKPIDLIINSQGGSMAAGFQILDDMMGSPAEIRTICTQKAYSMAAIIFSAGAKRYMYPHAQIVLHQPYTDNTYAADITSLKNISEEMIRCKSETDRILAANTGKTVKEITEVTDTVTVFNAQDAIEFGLCDELITLGKLLEDQQ